MGRPPSETSNGLNVLGMRMLVGVLLSAGVVNALDARWGYDLQLLPSPPTLLITSGKTPSTNGQTYTSTPSSPSYVSIPLSAPFSLADVASLANVSTGIAPDAAWGSGQVLSDGGAWWFGGEAGGGGAQTGSDSLWRRPKEGGDWERSTDESQPMRRLGGASCTLGTTTYLTAGIRADGSNIPITSTYAYSSSSSAFTLLSATLPLGLVQPSLHCHSNGTLLLLGGYSPSQSSLPPLSTAYTLDTSRSDADWQTIGFGGEGEGGTPKGRRSHLGVTFGNGKGVFVFGGGEGANGLERVLDDAWVLDLDEGSWVSVKPEGKNPGARLDVRGVAVGDSQVLFFGGYQTISAADSDLYLYDLGTNAYLTTFSPPSAWSVSSSSSSTDTSSQGAATTIDDTGPSLQTTLVPTTYTTTLISSVPLPQGTPSVTSGNDDETDSSIDDPSFAPPGSATSFSLSAYATSVITSTYATTITHARASDAALATATLSSSPTSLGSRPNSAGTIDATYTGIRPGGVTYSTNLSAGSTYHRPSSSSSAGSGASTPVGSNAKTIALAVGTSLGIAALVGAAIVLVVVRKRRRSRGGWDGSEKWGLVGDGDNDDDEGYQGGGTWGDAAGAARGEKRPRYFGGLVGMFGDVLRVAGRGGIGGGREKGAPRFDILAEEDTRMFETYPPPHGSREAGGSASSRPSDYGGSGWGRVGLWNRSSSYVGSLVSGVGGGRAGGSTPTPALVVGDQRETAARSTGEENEEEGDLGMGMLLPNESPDDPFEEGRGLLGGEEGFAARYSDPFSDANKPPSPPPLFLPRSPPLRSFPIVLPLIATPAASSSPYSSTPLPRSAAMASFYPNISRSSHTTEPTAISTNPQTGHSTPSDTTPTASRSSSPSASVATPTSRPPSSSLASSHATSPSHTSPLPTSVTSTTLSSIVRAPSNTTSPAVTRSQSTASQLSTKSTGWRRVLGLGLRTKSPPAAPSSSSVLPSYRLMMDLRDPSTPPSLDFVEEERGLSSLGRETRERLGLLASGSTAAGSRFHGQDGSVNDSLRSARTANSDAIEAYGTMDIVQRSRSTSGSSNTHSTLPSSSNSTPAATPDLDSGDLAFDPYPFSSPTHPSFPSSNYESRPALKSAHSSYASSDPFADSQEEGGGMETLDADDTPLISSNNWSPASAVRASAHKSAISPPPRDSFSSPTRIVQPLRPGFDSTTTSSSIPFPSSAAISSPSIHSTSSPFTAINPSRPLRRSVRETVAALESHSRSRESTPTSSSASRFSTPTQHSPQQQRKQHSWNARHVSDSTYLTSPPAPLNVVGKRARKKTTSFVAVPRPTLGIANPDT